MSALRGPRVTFNDRVKGGEAGGRSRPEIGGGQLVVGLLILTFLMGLIGGAGSIALVSSSVQLRKWLGVTDSSPLNLTKTVQERLVIEESNGFIQAVEKVGPAVVSISTQKAGLNIFGEIVQQEGAGTGFIITSDGLIVTNKHVVDDANTAYTVFMADGKKFDAKVMAKDPFNDLAILKIEATGLPTVELGDSDGLKVGQWVIAIGNAFGKFDNSVSVGVVSAKNRKLDGSGSAELTGLLQTDATINPGNSGGPLVNLKGQVIGVNTAIFSGTGTSTGISFAIPINSIKKAIDSFRKTGAIIRPMMGVRYVSIDSTIVRELKLTVDHGALLLGREGSPAIVQGGPAEKAGLQTGDIILSINGERVDENKPLSNLVVKYAPGDVVTLRVLRGKEEKDFQLTLGELR